MTAAENALDGADAAERAREAEHRLLVPLLSEAQQRGQIRSFLERLLCRQEVTLNSEPLFVTGDATFVHERQVFGEVGRGQMRVTRIPGVVRVACNSLRRAAREPLAERLAECERLALCPKLAPDVSTTASPAGMQEDGRSMHVMQRS